jgi:hypothetical protein
VFGLGERRRITVASSGSEGSVRVIGLWVRAPGVGLSSPSFLALATVP